MEDNFKYFGYEIKLDSETASYEPGDLVSGHFEINAALPLEFKAINVTYRGESYVYGIKRERYTDTVRGRYVKVDHVAHEQYLMVTECVRGKTQLQPGTHCVLLQCEIPITAPSTFYGKYGCVHYAVEVKVEFEDPSKDQYILKKFQVVAPLDLTSIENIRHPILIELEKEIVFFGLCVPQALKIGVSLPSGGFCAGQRVPIDVCVSNRTHVKVKRIIISLVRRQRYHSEALGTIYFKESDLVRVIQRVQTFANVNFTTYINIPEIVTKMAPNLQNCCIIDVEFFIKVTAKLKYFKTQVLTSQAKVHIGSIPLTDWHEPNTITETSLPLSNMPLTGTPDVNTELPESNLNSNVDCMYPFLERYPWSHEYVSLSGQQGVPIGICTDIPTIYPPHRRDHRDSIGFSLYGRGSHIAVAPSAPPME